MKTLRHKTIIFIAATFLVLFPLASSVCGASGEEVELVVEGTVVARYLAIGNMICQDGWNQENIIVLRIERQIKGSEPHQYVRVHYPFICGLTSPLPTRIYNAKRYWRFTLTRSQECDGPLKGDLYPTDDRRMNERMPFPSIYRTTHAEDELVPFDTEMHCYQLKPKGFKSLSGEKPKRLK